MFQLIHILPLEPEDYMAREEVLSLDGSTSRVCLQIPIVDDDLVENPEDFPVMISSPDPNVIIMTPPASTVIILDNDRATIGFEMPVYSVNESQGYVEVCAVLSMGLLEIPVQILLTTTDGTALSKFST